MGGEIFFTAASVSAAQCGSVLDGLGEFAFVTYEVYNSYDG